MRFLLLVLALATAGAHAQTLVSGEAQSLLLLSEPVTGAPLQTPEALPVKQPPLAGMVSLGLAGLGAGVGVLTYAANEGAIPLLALAPLASGAAVYVVGEAMGYGGDADRTLAGTAIGALPGAVIMAVGFSMDPPGADDLFSDGTVVIAAGALVYVIGGSVGAVLGYSSGSVLGLSVQRGPENEAVPSLNLRARL